MVPLGDEAQVEGHFGPFGDSANVVARYDADILGSNMTMPTTSIPKVRTSLAQI